MMVEKGVATFPPPFGRIPNFIGADEAAKRILSLNEYHDASVIKANPDSPQRYVREYALRDGKVIVFATPRLKKGFLVVKPEYVRGREKYASTIKGAFKYGKFVQLEGIPHVDFIVEGSVAVSYRGDRIGKGEGYGELEYAILRELGLVDEDVTIVTTVHDLQVFHSLPQDIFDVSVNYISTPTRLIKCKELRPRPKGIYWDLITERTLIEIPILREIKERRIRRV